MPTLTGTLADVTGTTIPVAAIREIFVKAPVERPSSALLSGLTVERKVTIAPSETLSVNLEPGPAVLSVWTDSSRDVFELMVTANMTTLREAVIENVGELPEFDQSMLIELARQVREDATEAHRVVSDAASTLAEMQATDTATGVSRQKSETAASAAKASETAAKTSETNAKASELAAKISESAAAGSATSAANSSSAANSAKTAAQAAQSGAEAARSGAQTQATNAAGSATASANSAAAADTSRAAAEAAKVAAEAAKMNWRGVWSSSTAYTARDVVFYQGSSFWATQSIAAGQAAPPAGNWQMLAQKGDPGANGSSAWADIQNKPSTFPPDTHKHPVGDINTPGTPSATTALFGDGWKVPPNTTYPPMPTAEAQAGTASTQSTVSAAVLKAGADAAVSARIQLVSAFPASPVTGVLYLKAE